MPMATPDLCGKGETSMATARNDVPPLIRNATAVQVAAILGAMREVAETGSPATDADRHAITGAGRYMFGRTDLPAFDAIAPVSPAALAAALTGSDLAEDAAKFLTI